MEYYLAMIKNEFNVICSNRYGPRDYHTPNEISEKEKDKGHRYH